MIRVTKPSEPTEGTLYTDHIPDFFQMRAKAEGWVMTTITTRPDLSLPTDADRLWQGVLQTRLHWKLVLRTDPVKGHKITHLHIQGLAPDRDPDQWSEWSWADSSMGRNGQPRIPLYRARILLATHAA